MGLIDGADPGEATTQDIEEGDVKPTYVFDSVKEIYEGLTEA